MSYGEPEDQPGECNARLHLADDFGDNRCTVRCQLPAGHDGTHLERCRQDVDLRHTGARAVDITWEGDDRQARCGCDGCDKLFLESKDESSYCSSECRQRAAELEAAEESGGPANCPGCGAPHSEIHWEPGKGWKCDACGNIA